MLMLLKILGITALIWVIFRVISYAIIGYKLCLLAAFNLDVDCFDNKSTIKTIRNMEKAQNQKVGRFFEKIRDEEA